MDRSGTPSEFFSSASDSHRRVMGLSRRQFTKEFKLAAVWRLDAGVFVDCGLQPGQI
jgi:hypothetical protein